MLVYGVRIWENVQKISLDMGLGIEGSHQMDCENVAITAFSMRPEEIF